MFCFFEDFDVANCADDSTPYCTNKSAYNIFNNLEQSSKNLFEWLNKNYTKANTGKNYLLLSENSRATAITDNIYIELDEQVLLGITIDLTLLLKNISIVFARKHVKS